LATAAFVKPNATRAVVVNKIMLIIRRRNKVNFRQHHLLPYILTKRDWLGALIFWIYAVFVFFNSFKYLSIAKIQQIGFF